MSAVDCSLGHAGEVLMRSLLQRRSTRNRFRRLRPGSGYQVASLEGQKILIGGQAALLEGKNCSTGGRKASFESQEFQPKYEKDSIQGSQDRRGREETGTVVCVAYERSD